MALSSRWCPGNYQVVRNVNPSEFGRAIPLIGKDGMPIAYFEQDGDSFYSLVTTSTTQIRQQAKCT